MRIKKENSIKEKRGQEEKCKILASDLKRGQEEMVGFGLIIILVAVVMIVFLAIYVRKPTEIVQNYEATSYIQSLLQVTTRCQGGDMINLSIQELIYMCEIGGTCEKGPSDSCRELEREIKYITKESWKPGNKNPVQGYTFLINVSYAGQDEQQLLSVSEGMYGRANQSRKGSVQEFGEPNGDKTLILFTVYSDSGA